MMESHVTGEWILLTFITFALTVSGAGLKEHCFGTEECPRNSLCKVKSCELFICQCDIGYSHFPDNECTKVALIEESCADNSTCLPVNSICNSTSGLCECEKGYTASRDGFACKDNNMGLQPDLDDPCSGNAHCDFFSHCANGTCDCRGGFERWTLEEKWLLYPRPTFLSCKTSDLAIDMCDGVKISRPKTPHHQAKPTPKPSTTPSGIHQTTTENGRGTSTNIVNHTGTNSTPSKAPTALPVFVPKFVPFIIP